jgi:hypothetical protein
VTNTLSLCLCLIYINTQLALAGWISFVFRSSFSLYIFVFLSFSILDHPFRRFYKNLLRDETTKMSSFILLALALLAAPSAAQIGTGCVKGVDCTPPMGWRSWNTYGQFVTQDLMESVMDAMAATNDDGASFLSLGTNLSIYGPPPPPPPLPLSFHYTCPRVEIW